MVLPMQPVTTRTPSDEFAADLVAGDGVETRLRDIWTLSLPLPEMILPSS